MDHRISKDMISSGMIPSGEKKQEDLSRTQYGTAPSPNALSDVYKSMYEKKEETLNEHHKKDADGNTIPHEDEELNEAGPLAALAPFLGKLVPIMKGAKTAAIRTGIKVGGKPGGKFVKSAIDKPLQTAANVSYASNMMPQTSSGKDGKDKTAQITAGADLFDIVKGKLLDEGLSEEEIRDIMLTLTPDEIMNEMNAGPSTPVRIDDVEKGDGTKTKRVMHNLGAGRKGAIRPKPGFKMNPVTNDPVKEEYKNFDPKNPDPKQVKKQVELEKNKQKFNDPMGVKNANIGGRGKDLG